MADVNKVLAVADAEIGYIEKRSNCMLDEKTANAGSGNWTKYARDLDALGNFYNGPKNGYAWCDVFVDWCFVKAYGVTEAKRLLCEPYGSAGAGVTYSAQYYAAHGRFHHSPSLGAQIFFGRPGAGTHTGLVVGFDETYVWTIEGNTGSSSGVIPNGGMVCKKKYLRTYDRIYGYGWPDFDGKADTAPEPARPAKPSRPSRPTYYYSTGMPLLKPGMEGPEVKAMQILLNGLGYAKPALDEDGEYGQATASAVENVQRRTNQMVDGECGIDTWTVLLSLKK